MTDEYDAFTQGVTLGGMRTKNDIKILLCYILSSLDSPISKTGLNAVLQTTELANFFEVNDALSALCENGLIIAEKREDDEYLSLSAEGFSAASRLETEIPLFVRDAAVKAALEIVSREKMRCCAQAYAEKLERGYRAVLSITDSGTLMMKTELYVADSLQADAVCKSFLENPAKLYGDIIACVTH